MWKDLGLVMLPSDKKASIGDYIIASYEEKAIIDGIDKTGHLGCGTKIIEGTCKQKLWDLYFYSDEEIKKGFEGYAIVTVKDDTRIKYLVEVIVTEKKQCYCKGDRKFSFEYYSVNPLVVTTDTSLRTSRIDTTPNSIWKINGALFPQPTKQFIEYYINEYNKDNKLTKVQAEYEVDYNIKCTHTIDECKELAGNCSGCELCTKAIWKIKVSTDNTINIKQTKDSWSREELVDVIEHYLLINEVDVFKRTKRLTIKEFVKNNL